MSYGWSCATCWLLVTIGLGIGVPAALAGERLDFQFALRIARRWTQCPMPAAIAILGFVVAGFAAYWPARRASLVDPAIALRYE